MVDKSGDVSLRLALLCLLSDLTILIFIRRNIIFLLQVDLELPFVMLLHDLVAFVHFFFVVVVFVDLLILHCLFWILGFRLRANVNVLLFNHLLVLVDLLL